VLEHEDQCAGDDAGPQRADRRRDQPTQPGLERSQHAARIAELDAERQRIETRPPLRHRLFVTLLEQRDQVRWQIALQEFGSVQLRDQLDDLGLGRRMFAGFLQQAVPDHRQRVLAIAAPDDGVGARIEPLLAALGTIHEQIVGLAAHIGPPHFDVRTQARSQFRDAIPRRTE
jgi:hypothetical protein